MDELTFERRAVDGTPQEVERTVFLIDEAPCVFWGRISETNRRFLSGIDVGYWEYQALTHADRISCEDESAQHAATALRVAYGQGVETLLALLCALAQAPWFPVGWMSRYKNRDLRSVVEKIHNGRPVPSACGTTVSWESLSRVVHAFVGEPTKSDTQLVARFAATWRQFAGQFLDRHFEPEYNSLKHGMRAGGGPFAFSIQGPSEKNGEPGRTALAGRAEFGSTFRDSRRVPGTRRSLEFSEETSRRWSPPQFIAGLQLVGVSIGNIVSRLRTTNGEDPKGLRFSCPHDPAAFERARREDDEEAWLGHVTFSQPVDAVNLPPEPTADELRAEYEVTRTRRRVAGTLWGTLPGQGEKPQSA